MQHRRGTAPALLFFALIFLNCSAASAIECRAEKGHDGWWAWRLIDGKKCWYQGRAGVDKAKLEWSFDHSKPVKLEECCWPPLEKAE
jgi:hypothetical protein